MKARSFAIRVLLAILICTVLCGAALGAPNGGKVKKVQSMPEVPSLDQEVTTALKAFFEGHDADALEILEPMSRNSDNPLVFHMLSFMEYRKDNKQNYKRINYFVKTIFSLIEKNGDAVYKAMLPLAEYYASEGSDSAKSMLGDLYKQGIGVEKDHKKAIAFFTDPANHGDAYSQAVIGNIYRDAKNYTKALEWYRKAADQGLAWAQGAIGAMYSDGQGVKKNSSHAVEWLRKSTAQERASIEAAMKSMTLDKEFTSALMAFFEGRDADALKILEPMSSDSDNPLIFHILSFIEYRKDKPDYHKIDLLLVRRQSLLEQNGGVAYKAIPLAEHYASEGSDRAKCILGYLYQFGIDVKKDAEKAIAFFTDPANHGDAPAQAAIGGIYYVANDHSKAFEWLSKAAEQGYAWAQFKLADMYLKGEGVQQNKSKSIEFLLKAAEQNYGIALYWMGLAYEAGNMGVTKDIDKSIEWYRKAADNGYDNAKEALSRLYDLNYDKTRTGVSRNGAAVDLRNVKVGSYVMFGHYEQDNDSGNGKEPIEWVVLAKEDDRRLLVSRYGLDCRKYNDDLRSATWNTCTLREWLNSDFLNSAFSDDEQKSIVSSQLTNPQNPEYEVNGGSDTSDRIFLLSIDEAKHYFSSDSDRTAEVTLYAKSHGSYSDDNENSWWWLRSPGAEDFFAACVRVDGSVQPGGVPVVKGNNALRPALWVQM